MKVITEHSTFIAVTTRAPSRGCKLRLSVIEQVVCPLSVTVLMSGVVKGLRCGPLRSADGEAPGPASESLQGKNPRPGAVRYGDFAERRGLRDRARRGAAV